jgi:hypothetical protein
MKGKGKTWGRFDKNTRNRHSREDQKMQQQIAASNLRTKEAINGLLRTLPGGIAAILFLCGLCFGIYKLITWVIS